MYSVQSERNRPGLESLANTEINEPADGQVLSYSGSTSKWINKNVLNDDTNDNSGATKKFIQNFQTMSNTPATIYSFTTKSGGPHGTSYTISAVYNVCDVNGGDSTGSIYTIFKAKNKNGVVSTVGPASVTTLMDPGLSSTAVNIISNGTMAQLQVVGLQSTTLNWCATFKIQSQDF